MTVSPGTSPALRDAYAIMRLRECHGAPLVATHDQAVDGRAHRQVTVDPGGTGTPSSGPSTA
ncbi:hypothetical protein ETD86_29135 [Nonomuraea turkmeniaca]|uniref:Uncharacterized protein n=1 Tax=Nonomuraea turkmeniaca TaxID=103838 RepID=A0A5S4FAQ4_9ACTN|nr:hypothetical protein [Nonomuraea turkmeniaca]TMR14213.1 hypothetical protein ETD86_29135 [Nonomuraea turkmeniaca]